MPLIVEAESLSGTFIEDAIRDAIDLAVRLGVVVSLGHGGTAVLVTPRDNVESVLKKLSPPRSEET